MDGVQLRLRRRFDPDGGRAFVTAVDHGLATGPQPVATTARAAARVGLPVLAETVLWGAGTGGGRPR